MKICFNAYRKRKYEIFSVIVAGGGEKFEIAFADLWKADEWKKDWKHEICWKIDIRFHLCFFKLREKKYDRSEELEEKSLRRFQVE